MFGLSGWEIPLIVLLALLFFGGKKLPELARGFGESIRTVKKEVQRASDDVADIKSEIDEVKQAAKIEPTKKKAASKTTSTGKAKSKKS